MRKFRKNLCVYLILSFPGDGEMESLCYPAGNALARLTVHCLAANIKIKTSGPYTTKKRKFRYNKLTFAFDAFFSCLFKNKYQNYLVRIILKTLSFFFKEC